MLAQFIYVKFEIRTSLKEFVYEQELNSIYESLQHSHDWSLQHSQHSHCALTIDFVLLVNESALTIDGEIERTELYFYKLAFMILRKTSNKKTVMLILA